MYWNIKEIQAPELANWLETKAGEFRVVDVREMREIMAGTIAGAEPMPMATVPARAHELGRDETIVFVCRSGARSGQVCAFLQQQGYDKVYNLRGGMIAWVQNGLPATLPQAV
jgi:rhodanese-related sulfurtransferase